MICQENTVQHAGFVANSLRTVLFYVVNAEGKVFQVTQPVDESDWTEKLIEKAFGCLPQAL